MIEEGLVGLARKAQLPRRGGQVEKPKKTKKRIDRTIRGKGGGEPAMDHIAGHLARAAGHLI